MIALIWLHCTDMGNRVPWPHDLPAWQQVVLTAALFLRIPLFVMLVSPAGMLIGRAVWRSFE